MRKEGARLFALAAAAALGSCSAPKLEVSIPQLPSDVLYGALVFEDELGAPLASTELLVRRFGEAFTIEHPAPIPDHGLVRFAGWSEGALAPVLPDDLATMHGAVARATATDKALPAATWAASGTLSGDRVQLEPASATPALTAPWLPSCPLLVPSGETPVIDFSCAPAHCAPRLTQSACTLELDTGDCFAPAMSGEIDPNGSVTLSNAAIGHCSSRAASDNAESILAFSCTEGPFPCELDVYAPLLPSRFRTRSEPIISPELDGYLTNLVVLDDAILAGARKELDLRTCAGGAPGVVVFVDPESMTETSRATLPPCMAQIARDPDGDGFLAIFGEVNRRIARYDRAGNEVLARDVVVPELGADHFALAMVTEHGTPSAIAVSYRLPLDNHSTQYLVAFDSASLSTRSVTAFEGKISSITARSSNLIGVAVDDTDLIYNVDLSQNGARDEGLGVTSIAQGRSRNLETLVFHPPLGRYVVSSRGITAAMYIVDGEENPAAAYFERQAHPGTISPWPADSRLLLVGLQGLEGDRAGIIALFDPDLRRPRYLPGSTVIGSAEPRGAIPDARGRVWIALPPTGELVRVEPP